MKNRIFSILLALLAVVGLQAQKQNVRDYVSIRFVPNHADWTYRCGEQVQIQVAAVRHYVPIAGAELNYAWGPELCPPQVVQMTETGADGITTLTLDGAEKPGFKTLTVRVMVDGKEYKNYINLAFDPQKIQPTTQLPQDFKTFWDQSIQKARQVPLQTRITPRPDLSDENCDAYEVRFQNMEKGQYLYGTLCTPKGVRPDGLDGRRCPVVIIWPGAGVKPHPGVRQFFPEHGIITLEMGINGIPVNLPQELYDDLRYNAMKDYNTIHLDNREQYYYHRVYAGTVKTVDMLCSLPCVDSTCIGVLGGSQGGLLTVVNAALDPRVKAAGIAYPAMAETAGYVHGRVSGWPHFFKKQAEGDEAIDQRKVEVLEYYDAVNFARFIKCPVWFQIGYNDQTCCPTSTYSVYNVLKCKKQLNLPLDCAHWMYEEHKLQRAQWLLEQLTDNK